MCSMVCSLRSETRHTISTVPRRLSLSQTLVSLDVYCIGVRMSPLICTGWGLRGCAWAVWWHWLLAVWCVEHTSPIDIIIYRYGLRALGSDGT